MAGEHHEARIERVETEVQTVRTEMATLTRDVGGLKADVKGLGSILGRIEQGVLRAQEKSEERDLAGKPNLVAVVSVLITIISIIVGGAWLISGQLARMDERSQWVMKQIDKNEQRIWRAHKGGPDGVAPETNP
jgi:uncharacterized protein (UPF0335 family)